MIKTISFGVILLVAIVNNVQSLDKLAFDKLEPCQLKCDQVYTQPKANPVESKDSIGCKYGCNIQIMEGIKNEINCEERCKQYTGGESEIAACVKGCMNFEEKSKPAIEQPIITEVKNIDDVVKQNVEVNAKPAILIDNIPDSLVDKKNDEKENSSEEKKDDSSSEEDDGSDKSNVKIESPIDIFNDFFSSQLVKGEPQVIDTKDSDAYLLQQNNQDSDSSDDSQLSGSTFENLFSYFDKLKETFKSAIDKGSYMLRVRMFSNGTVVKEYSELPDDTLPESIFNSFVADDSIDGDNSEPKLIRIQDPFNINDKEPINWKGRPMIVGKPIDVPFDDSFGNDMSDVEPQMHHFRFRECRPIKFHFSTLCHDINNLFTCAQMRTGLPRWFFLTMLLTISFLMLWLGLFILSMMRRMRRRERVIYHHEEYLPLYKDIDFEVEKGQLNSGYNVIEAGPLPVKVKPEDQI